MKNVGLFFVKRRAFTFVEVLVALTIMVGLSFVIFKVLNYASNTRAIANAKGVAKTEVEIALRQIARDLSRAKAPTIPEYKAGRRALATGTALAKLTVTEPTSDGVREVPVQYTWDLDAKTLTREADGKTHTYSTHLEKMWIDYAGNDPERTNVVNATGTVLVIMETKVTPEGKNPDQSHHQEIMVTIQGEMGKNLDGNWRKTEDFISNF